MLAESLTRVAATDSLDFVLPAKDFDVFTIAPIHALSDDIHFAAVGLIDKYNSGGAIEKINLGGGFLVELTLVGGGSFAAFSSVEPGSCTFAGETVAVSYDKSSSKLLVTIPFHPGSSSLKIEF